MRIIHFCKERKYRRMLSLLRKLEVPYKEGKLASGDFRVYAKIKESLKAFGAENAIMSGSGPTVFGIFEEKNTADKAAEKIIEKFKIKEVYSVETI